MSRINVDVSVKLPDEKEKKKDPNWPNILEDEEGLISQAIFKLYDGATTATWRRLRKDVRWRGTGGWAPDEFYLANDIIIESGSLYVASVNHTAQADEEPGVGENWGSRWKLLAETAVYDATGWVDSRSYPINTVILDDDDTCWISVVTHTSESGVNDPGLWQDSEFLFDTDVAQVATKTYEYEHPGLPDEDFPTWSCTSDFDTNEWIYTLFSNSMSHDVDALANEWDSTNELRFLRKPIGIVTDRDGSYRWTMSGEQNIRIRLIREFEADPKCDVSPDLLLDDEKVGGVTIKEGTPGDIPSQYKYRGLGKFHIKLDEIGTRSFAQYLNKHPVNGTEYAWDWIEPPGFYWCPFDTSDTTNFKVTTEPSYDADAVTFPIISVIGTKRIELFLIPRTWAYYCRNWQVKYTFGGTVYCYDTTSPPPPDRDEFMVSNVLKKTTHAFHIGTWFDRWPNTFSLGTVCDDEGELVFDPAGGTYPLAFASQLPEGDSAKASMIEHLEAAGLDTDDLISGLNNMHVLLYMGGIIGAEDDDDGLITVNHGGWITHPEFPELYYDYKTPLIWSRANFKMFETTPACVRGPEPWQSILCQLDEYMGYPTKQMCHCIGPSTDVWTPIWTKVQESNFYEKYGISGNSLLGGYDQTPDDNVPYGVGLVPSVAENLVGIVKIASTLYYIWRVTNEELTLHSRLDTDAPPDRNYGFESSMEVDWAAREAIENGAAFYMRCYPTIYAPGSPYETQREEQQPIPMSPFNVTNGREITGAFRPQPTIDDEGHVAYSGETSGQEYSFAASIFVLGGRERYLKTVEEIDGWVVKGRVWRHGERPCDGWAASLRNQR